MLQSQRRMKNSAWRSGNATNEHSAFENMLLHWRRVVPNAARFSRTFVLRWVLLLMLRQRERMMERQTNDRATETECVRASQRERRKVKQQESASMALRLVRSLATRARELMKVNHCFLVRCSEGCLDVAIATLNVECCRRGDPEEDAGCLRVKRTLRYRERAAIPTASGTVRRMVLSHVRSPMGAAAAAVAAGRENARATTRE